MDGKWVLGGLCVAAGLGFLLYRWSEDRTVVLSKERLVAVLRAVREATASLLGVLARASNVSKTRTAADAVNLQADATRKMHHAAFLVYQEFRVTEEDVRRACADWKDDAEVKVLAEDMRRDVELASKGVPPKGEFHLPTTPLGTAGQKVAGEWDASGRQYGRKAGYGVASIITDDQIPGCINEGSDR